MSYLRVRSIDSFAHTQDHYNSSDESLVTGIIQVQQLCFRNKKGPEGKFESLASWHYFPYLTT